MPDINLNLPETAKNLVKPANKLIEVVSGAIGKVYEPTNIRRLAKARADEIETIAKVARKNNDTPIKYESEEVLIDASSYKELEKRAANRFMLQEAKKQHNIEVVMNKAHKILEDEDDVVDSPVNQDWITRFISSIEDISNETMQDVWAKILAGEIKRPQTFSLRALETVKNLSSDEAQLFQSVAPLILTDGNRFFLPNDSTLLKKHNIPYSTLLKLDECGLISSNSMIATDFKMLRRKSPIIYNQSALVKMYDPNNIQEKVTVLVFLLHGSGEQLFQAIQAASSSNIEFVIDFAETLRTKYSMLNISAHKVNSIDGSTINFQESDILPKKH